MVFISLKMSLEELQGNFELALKNFDRISRERGFTPENITCNEDYGVFINFDGVEVNYSHRSLEDNLGDYLAEQVERHKIYLRSLKHHALETQKELRRFNHPAYSFLQRFFKPRLKELENKLDETTIEVAFDKVLQEGALLGKYFFEEIAVDYTKNRFDERRQRLVTYTKIIHKKAKELESLDKDKLQYFRNKNLLWYGK